MIGGRLGRKLGMAPLAALLLPSPALAQEVAPSDCAEVASLREEHAAIDGAIGDIAMGKKPKRRIGAADAGRVAAGTAIGLLLPFPLGAAVSAGTSQLGKSKKAREPGPDVPAMIERQNAIEARLQALDGGACAVG